MRLWQLIGYCADGNYLAGDEFINERGQTITFNGKCMVGLDTVEVDSIWEHTDDYIEHKA